jgi:hypothetical protein
LSLRLIYPAHAERSTDRTLPGKRTIMALVKETRIILVRRVEESQNSSQAKLRILAHHAGWLNRRSILRIVHPEVNMTGKYGMDRS